MDNHLSMLISGAEIRAKIKELAAGISADYTKINPEQPVLVLCTLRGAVFFAADLVRALTVPCEIDFLKVHCYNGMRPAGSPIFDLGESICVKDRYVLIVEDIVDTGLTMETVMQNFADKGAADIRICSLLDKPSRRLDRLKGKIQPDYIGFSIDDVFAVGWGMDYNDRFRLLPDLMIYHPEQTA